MKLRINYEKGMKEKMGALNVTEEKIQSIFEEKRNLYMKFKQQDGANTFELHNGLLVLYGHENVDANIYQVVLEEIRDKPKPIKHRPLEEIMELDKYELTIGEYNLLARGGYKKYK